MCLRTQTGCSCSPSSISEWEVSENTLHTHQTPDATAVGRAEKYHAHIGPPNSQEKIWFGVIIGYSRWENASLPGPDLILQTHALFPQVLTKMHT